MLLIFRTVVPNYSMDRSSSIQSSLFALKKLFALIYAHQDEALANTKRK